MRVVDQTHLMFPSYDGNGMYLSMGNITANPHVGFLFIDFERPFRLRVQGEAEVSDAPEHLACFKEAELVVRVKITELWMNCPRYIHRYQKLKTSRYVPQADVETPLCEWKRIEPRAGRAAPARAGAGGARPAPSPSRSGSAASSPATRRRRRRSKRDTATPPERSPTACPPLCEAAPCALWRYALAPVS